MSRILLVVFLVGATSYWLARAPQRAQPPAPPVVDWAAVVDDPAETLPIACLYTFTREIQPDSVAKAIIESRMNIHLELRYVPMVMAEARKPLSLISAPADVFMVESGSIGRYQKHGLLLPIPRELLQQHCPTLVAAMDRHAPWVWPSVEVDNVGYGCPVALWCEARNPPLGAWHREALAAVGISEAPSTLEAYTETFRKLHEAGYNCMSGDVSSGGAETAFTEIFGAFGVQPFDWMLQDGEVVYGGTLPSARQALGLLREWYAAGYIHPDFVTDRWWAEGLAKFRQGQVAYHNHVRQADATMLPAVPPLGPGGERGIRAHAMAGGQSLCFGAHLADEPQKVLRVLRMLETLMTEQTFYLETHLGRRGEHWEMRDGAIVQLPPFDQPGTRFRHGLGTPAQLGGATVLTFTGAGPEIYEPYLPPGPRKPEWGRPSVLGRYDVVPELRTLAQTLRRRQLSLYVAIIKGQKPLSTFEDFVHGWNADGAELLREVRKHYARQLEIIGQ
jgi:putative aldouronate transport system substrate-binding protein